MQISIKQLKKALEAKNYRFFENDSKNFNLNLIGIRSAENKSNAFNDWLFVVWQYQGLWNQLQFRITTDPGLYWLEAEPLNELGTAIVKPGQYRGLWQIGKHQNKYKALVQRGPITVIRDADRDGQMDLQGGTEQEGLFGINLHRANARRQSIRIDRWSAGCQVFADPQDFNVFLQLCTEAAKNWGDSFSYTLLEEGAL